MEVQPSLPEGMHVFERGWLSSNNVLVVGPDHAGLVDTGYASHAELTVAMVHRALEGRALDSIVNTHLHSDHCGGNAALQQAFPSVQTMVPPGMARAVREWDDVALTFQPTGQACPQFQLDCVVRPGSVVALGAIEWEVHGAPGHDPHSIILFDPVTKTLLSADALWQNGFGVVFQELEGIGAFDEVGETLDVIERLGALTVVPGHGSVFTDVASSLARARSRLQAYRENPIRHAGHAAKVLLKFKLLDAQRLTGTELENWVAATPYFSLVHRRWFYELPFASWISQLVQDLIRSGAARSDAGVIVNC